MPKNSAKKQGYRLSSKKQSSKVSNKSSEKVILSKISKATYIVGFITLGFEIIYIILGFIKQTYADYFNYILSPCCLALSILSIIIGAKSNKIGDVNNFPASKAKSTFITLGIILLCFPIIVLIIIPIGLIFFWLTPLLGFAEQGLEIGIAIAAIQYEKALIK